MINLSIRNFSHCIQNNMDSHLYGKQQLWKFVCRYILYFVKGANKLMEKVIQLIYWYIFIYSTNKYLTMIIHRIESINVLLSYVHLQFSRNFILFSHFINDWFIFFNMICQLLSPSLFAVCYLNAELCALQLKIWGRKKVNIKQRRSIKN